jgi:hypothetical protein
MCKDSFSSKQKTSDKTEALVSVEIIQVQRKDFADC